MASTGRHRALWSILLSSFEQWANDNSKAIDTANLGLAGDVAESFKQKDHTDVNMCTTNLH